MSSALPIISAEMNRGSSGNGVTYYRTAWTCARRARLDKELGDGDPGYSAKVGIIGHAILEQFYTNRLAVENVPAIQISDVGYVDPGQEAVRLCRSYLSKFPEREFWGSPVGAEMLFPLPGGEEQVRSFFQVELTARMDLITRVSLHHADMIRGRTGLDVPPGVLIVDHKFKPGGKDGDKQKRPQRERRPQDKYDFSLQFTAYPLMWNLFHPDDLCIGMVANIIVGLKEPEFQPVFIPAPDEHDVEVLRQWLVSGALLASTDVPNASACYDDRYDKVCSHYEYGRCKRA